MKLPPRRWRVLSSIHRQSPSHLSRAYLFKSGRLAIHAILASIKAQYGEGSVALPAYHCDSMVEACEWSGLELRYFSVNDDLSPDTASLQQAVTDDTRAALLVHYFGFPTISQASVDICMSAGVPIIEDAAHIDLMRAQWPSHAGRSGQWIIGSSRKFHAVYDGGCAFPLQNSAPSLPEPRRATMKDELRSISYLLAQARLKRVRSGCIPSNDDELMLPDTPSTPDERSNSDTPPEQPVYIDNRFAPSGHDHMTRLSALIAAGSHRDDASDRRRANYERIAAHLAPCTRSRMLFPSIENGDIVPYVLPLILHDPHKDHPLLRGLGIELLRWETLFTDRCSVSNEFAQRLVQIPCHEELQSDQIDYLVKCLQAVLT